MSAVVAGHVLHADDACLWPPEVPPLADPPHLVPVKDDFPEEIVRREEHQVSAQIAVAPDQVVLVSGRVLLVTGKDDQVVIAREEVAVCDVLEIQVGEEIHVSAGAEPADDRGIEIAEAVRDSRVGVRPVDVDSAKGPVHVPAVSPAVAVGVGEVVRLPGVRRQNDRDPARAEHGRTDDKRRVADPAVAGRDPHEIEAACPLADPDADGTRRVPVSPPGDCRRRGDRARVGLRIRCALAVPKGEDVDVEREGIGRDRDDRRLSRHIPGPDRNADPLDADDRSLGANAACHREVVVDTPPSLRVGHRQLEHIRAARNGAGRRPDQPVPAGGERLSLGHDCLHGVLPVLHVDRLDDVQLDGRLDGEPEADDRLVAEAVAVRAHRCQQPAIACKRRRAVGHLQVEQPRSGHDADRRGGARRRGEGEGDDEHGPGCQRAKFSLHTDANGPLTIPSLSAHLRYRYYARR